ncbi:antitoxin [Actinomyces sp. W5033]|uniref:antitoxin n=1 Tax=Actinomyces sp. W5033 TaxID=3446479 RepID=UPI003EE18876
MEELAAIRRRAETVAGSPRDLFHDGTDAYDVASMLIIRLAALLERPEFAPYLTAVTHEERLAIRTTRSIVAHTGYRSMNDDLFWAAVTQRVPEILERVIAVPGASGSN